MKPTINFDDYAKIEIRVGKIIEASVPEGSEKLLMFKVDFGEEVGIRTIMSGIKAWYSPEEMVGVKTIWVVNLAPKKTPFGFSEGMLFCTNDREGKPEIVKFDDGVEVGSEFH